MSKYSKKTSIPTIPLMFLALLILGMIIALLAVLQEKVFYQSKAANIVPMPTVCTSVGGGSGKYVVPCGTKKPTPRVTPRSKFFPTRTPISTTPQNSY